MTAPLNPVSATTSSFTPLCPETELAQLRARVAELEQESAERTWMDDALKAWPSAPHLPQEENSCRPWFGNCPPH